MSSRQLLLTGFVQQNFIAIQLHSRKAMSLSRALCSDRLPLRNVLPCWIIATN